MMLAPLLVSGCGTTKTTRASDQLLLSDAVERSIASIDFQLLSNQKVYLDTTYIDDIKGLKFVHTGYITSALRHQLMACGCRIEPKKQDADYIVEVRMGALGTDDHTVTVGVPESRNLSTAASFVSNAPIVPTIPELALVRRNDRQGAAKIIAFAYNRTTKRPVWQSEVAIARSTAQDLWVFGAGPFQRGSIHKGVLFAGNSIKIPNPFALGREQRTAKAANQFDPIEIPVERNVDDNQVRHATILAPVEGAPHVNGQPAATSQRTSAAATPTNSQNSSKSKTKKKKK